MCGIGEREILEGPESSLGERPGDGGLCPRIHRLREKFSFWSKGLPQALKRWTHLEALAARLKPCPSPSLCKSSAPPRVRIKLRNGGMIASQRAGHAGQHGRARRPGPDRSGRVVGRWTSVTYSGGGRVGSLWLASTEMPDRTRTEHGQDEAVVCRRGSGCADRASRYL